MPRPTVGRSANAAKEGPAALVPMTAAVLSYTLRTLEVPGRAGGSDPPRNDVHGLGGELLARV